MGELTEGVNWLAVIIGTILSFILGWAWYSPMLFAKKWIEGINVKPNPDAKVPVSALVMQLIGTFLLAWLVGITAAHNALATIILIVLTIIVLIVANGIFTSKSNYAIATETGFVAAMAVVMIAVQAIL
jgi:Protein of unknown function (DUF1761)